MIPTRQGAAAAPQRRPLTYVAGNALLWVLLGAISISADQWYWWPVIPFVCWSVVLALHLWQTRPASPPERRREMTVLVTAASKHGATYEIADRIGRDLAERGVEVDVRPLDDVDDLRDYSAFVVGSAIYLGNWLKEGRSFVDAHAPELRERPTWLFASGSIVGDPPTGDDPNALRPELAKTLVATTNAREHRVFAGKLDRGKLGLLERAAVRGAHATEGDHRDWDAIDAWAAEIAADLRPGKGGDSNGS